MQQQIGVLNLVLLIGILQGSITMVTSKCDGVCVKLDECDNDFGGINLVNLRFGEKDYEEAECPHYLEVCCDAESVVTTRAPLVNVAGVNENGRHSDENMSNERPNMNNALSNENEAGSNVVNGGPNNNNIDPNRNNPGTNVHSIEVDQINAVEHENIAVENPSARSLIKPFGECGIRKPEGIRFRLENSQFNETQFGEFSWMVAILQAQLDADQPKSSYACGGSLISPNVVLTAAHCVIDKDAEMLTVRAGEWDTMTTNEVIPHQEQSVSTIIVHPHFNQNLLFHDIALLVLKDSFSSAENVQLACLPPQGKDFTDNDCFAAGWGKTAFDAQNYHAILKKVPLPMVPKAECQTALRSTRLGPRFRLHESFICAGGEEGIDTCTGDGGSPLVCPDVGSENKYYQAGIVAWGISCAQEGIPGVYVRTSLYTQWIDEELEKINVADINKRNNFGEGLK